MSVISFNGAYVSSFLVNLSPTFEFPSRTFNKASGRRETCYCYYIITVRLIYTVYPYRREPSLEKRFIFTRNVVYLLLCTSGNIGSFYSYKSVLTWNKKKIYIYMYLYYIILFHSRIIMFIQVMFESVSCRFTT